MFFIQTVKNLSLFIAVDEDDINLQSIEQKNNNDESSSDNQSPLAKHTPSVKDRMEAMGK